MLRRVCDRAGCGLGLENTCTVIGRGRWEHEGQTSKSSPRLHGARAIAGRANLSQELRAKPERRSWVWILVDYHCVLITMFGTCSECATSRLQVAHENGLRIRNPIARAWLDRWSAR